MQRLPRISTLCCLLLGALCLLAPAALEAADLQGPLELNNCGAGVAGDVHFTIAATGDTFPHENIQQLGEQRGYDYLFDQIRPYLQAADLAYTNFDGAMLASSPISGYPNFNYNPALAPALRNAGINLVSTANNHILDRGPPGLDATLAVLDAAGIRHHGAVRSDAGQRPAYLPLTLERNGVSLRIGFLAATWGTNGIPDPYQQVNLLWQSDQYGGQAELRQSVLDAIAQAARETDLVIVAAHWGFEYEFTPRDFQIAAAERMVAAGADIILGAQSHTLQPLDLVSANGRSGLVAYSLANFLASQGALQEAYYSATSVVLYIGVIRQADGQVRVSGYRYLPVLMVDADTRPAPLPQPGHQALEARVRELMRDPAGLRQLPAVAPDGPLQICPALQLGNTPEALVAGDFAHFLRSMGTQNHYSTAEILAVFGPPRGEVRRELAGDCQSLVDVRYTRNQRLELHPQNPWPYRVSGTQLGTAIYQQRYGVSNPTRITDLAAGTAFADQRFREFFERYGGVPVFGFPISAAHYEEHGQQQPVLVQYFERARFELNPAGSDLLSQVQLGGLADEARASDGLCRASTPATLVSVLNPLPSSVASNTPGATATQQKVATLTPVVGWSSGLLLLSAALLALSALALRDFRNYRERMRRLLNRQRRAPLYQRQQEFLRRLLEDPPAERSGQAARSNWHEQQP